MNYTLDELFEILQPESFQKKFLLNEKYESGFFYDLPSLNTQYENNQLIRLNDVLFEDDPFGVGSGLKIGNYDRYLSTAQGLMSKNRYKSKRLTYEFLEKEFYLYGGSDRSRIWDAMNTVTKVINPIRYVPAELELLGCFSLKKHELDQE